MATAMLIKNGMCTSQLRSAVSFSDNTLEEGESFSWENLFTARTFETIEGLKTGIYKIGEAKILIDCFQSYPQVRIESKNANDLERAIEWVVKKLDGEVETVYPSNPTTDSVIRGIANDLRTLVALIKTQFNKLRR